MDCCSSHPQTSALTTTQTSTVPESTSDTLSIRQIARLYAREQILISPITWTSRHVELLRCSFNDPVPASPNTKFEFTPEHDGYPFVKGYLRSWIKYTYRQRSIQRLLTNPECPLRFRSSAILRFDRISQKLPCTLLCYQDEEDTPSLSGLPVAAYADLGELEQMRINKLRCYKATRYSPLCNTIWHNRWKKLNPPEPLHDPYIVALLIAVAQEKRRHLSKAKSALELQNTFFSSQVLCSFKSKECLRLYTADISSFLLDMFDDSSLSPPAPISISIQISTVSISPEHTLRARLLGLLCPNYPQKAPPNLGDRTLDVSHQQILNIPALT